MREIDLTLTPLKSGLIAGRRNTTTVLLRVRAPDAPRHLRSRKPLNLALVIDRSGSMSGEPLRQAKRCARHIIKGIGTEDTASVTAYDSQVSVLAPSQRVGDRRHLLRAIDSIQPTGMTALYDGWRFGADQALVGHHEECLSRVLLLSDGNANRGRTHPREISKRVVKAARQGITTSTYGLGHHFNEELMMSMADAGGGNGYYGETAEDLMDPFREELDLMNAMFARRSIMMLETPKGVSVTVKNGYEQIRKNGWQLPDLGYGGEAWALIELASSGRFASKDRPEAELLRAAVKMKSVDIPVITPEATLRLPFVSPATYEVLPEHDAVRRRSQEVRAAQLQDLARSAARAGDWNRVDHLLAQARREAGENPWVEEAIVALNTYARRREVAPFSKEAAYSSSRMRTRLADPAESPDFYDLGVESEKPSFLRRKREQGKRMASR